MNAQATQIERPEIGARKCLECGGKGTIAVRPNDCNHGGLNCPCGMGEAVCPRCEGSKVESCTSCGEPATMRYLGEDWCDECATSEEYRFSACSLCDGPIDVRESGLPLCPTCTPTCQAHADLERARKDAEREERETGRRIA